jgi:hypothetical protein
MAPGDTAVGEPPEVTVPSPPDLVQILGLDPFFYLVTTIAGIAVWIYFTVLADFALSGGRTVWIRRLALAGAAVSALLFFYGAQMIE